MTKTTQLSSDQYLFLILVGYRIVNALVVRTYFDPDEYWQSVEVAHGLVFGYGYMTWEWKEGIRSILHPLIFGCVYKILASIGAPSKWIILGPRVFQGVVAAIGDLFMVKLARKMFDREAGQWTLFCMVTSWFWFYAGIRTYSNSMEAVLTWVGLYFWPWTTSSRLTASLLAAYLTFVIRPTGVMLWSFLGLSLLIRANRKISVLLKALAVGASVIAISFTLDRIFFRRWTCTFCNFAYLNIVEGISSYYGTHPWHWYITQGLPVIMGTHLPFAIYGMMNNRTPKLSTLTQAMAGTLSVYSLLEHKEFRFLLPLLGPGMMFAGKGLAVFCKRGKWIARSTILTIVVSNAVAAYYFSTMHKRGVVQVIEYLRQVRGNVTDVVFLMPCHSTPFYSHLHAPIPMRFLSCEPPLRIEQKQYYRDETTLFHQSVENFIVAFFAPRISENMTAPWRPRFAEREDIPPPRQNYTIKRYKWPSHLVFYENIEDELKKVIQWTDYRECARFFNGYFADDPRQSGDVVVYCRDAAAGESKTPLPKTQSVESSKDAEKKRVEE
ncbi:hypothetical protein SmJEL517_g03891 [Synchytrium microbalum]|uniref:Mannosyltransferase n=1 Tax=Synchytrium microbalum TaxID=1806994 RepID=A0A507BWK2_9FUNG|nr:uncharacterized protein SmJEL517_g03891 [Synchytrium microbalum]TPX33207.1 hypothetical protein SmJEL517_g03891 [Synchytrium microbalum]